jgi:hypothetical protein
MVMVYAKWWFPRRRFKHLRWTTVFSSRITPTEMEDAAPFEWRIVTKDTLCHESELKKSHREGLVITLQPFLLHIQTPIVINQTEFNVADLLGPREWEILYILSQTFRRTETVWQKMVPGALGLAASKGLYHCYRNIFSLLRINLGNFLSHIGNPPHHFMAYALPTILTPGHQIRRFGILTSSDDPTETSCQQVADAPPWILCRGWHNWESVV